MLAWLKALFSTDDASADSIIVGGALGILMLGGYQGYDLMWLHNAFNPATFGAGAAAILGAVGAGKRLRDGTGDAGGA